MYRVRKRDSSTVIFDIHKISNAIQKAFEGCNKSYTEDVINLIALRVTSDFQNKIYDGVIDVEDIQDSVEKVLSEAGYADVSKAYILYRKQRENVRNIDATALDYKSIVDKYLSGSAYLKKDNSDLPYSIGGLILSNSSAITANYWLSEVYDEEIAEAHKEGWIHIHDLNMLSGYCTGWSLQQIMLEGITGVDGQISRGSAKHLDTLCNQLVDFIGIMQNEWAGGQSFSSFDTFLAPYIKKDALSYKEIKQCMQSFMYGINMSSRWGTQPPFTNISIDWTVPKDLKDVHAIVGREEQPFTYGACQKEMDMLNQAIIEVMLEGDARGNMFPYPIFTYALTDDFDWEPSQNNSLLFELCAKYGTPYFANYIHTKYSQSDTRFFTKETTINYDTLYRKAGGFFGSGEFTGSIGLVTLNLPKIAYISKDEDAFYEHLDFYLDLSSRSLKTKRTVLTKLLETGLYPYTKQYLGTFQNHFSTIGMIGMNEACLNARWIQKDLTNEQAQSFALRVLQHMQQKLLQYQQQYHNLYALEATPAESISYLLAKQDQQQYPDIIVANMDGQPYYTNSTHLPLHATDDIFSALDIQDMFQPQYNAGTAFHAFLGERITEATQAMLLVHKIVKNYHIPYFTLSPTYSICKEHGYISGETPTCPICNESTEVYSRITGYYRPIHTWNEGKKQEFSDRQVYNVQDGLNVKIKKS